METKEMMEELTPADKSIRQSGTAENSLTRNDKLKFTKHARIRQEQRNVTDSTVSKVTQCGQQIDCKDTTIYTDQDINVVLSKDNNAVVTVKINTRNTSFLLSDRTEQKAKSLLYKVNEHKDNHAMCELANLYLTGELGEKDVRKAFTLYERAAKMGNSHAMCIISQLYATGKLGVPNLELANEWMKKAADRNNTFALAILGQRLLREYKRKYHKESNIFRPSGPKKEMEEQILYYLQKSADKGATRAIWQLGNIYEEGSLGEQDLSKAIDLYVKAAKTGSPTSLEYLHRMTQECVFSIEELEEILDSLLFMTRTSIGMAYQLGVEQLNHNLGYNPVRGLKIIEKVALKQYDEAVHTVALCYRDGISCSVNLKLAQYWFNKLHDLYDESAKAGNVLSIRKLAILYLNGNAGKINLEKAESCFRESIEKSTNPDPDWVYDLGMLYLNGILGDKSVDVGIKLIAQAIKLWQLQAESGKTDVYNDLGKAYSSIHDDKKAVYWLSKAPSNDVTAQCSLAKIFLNDLSCAKNVLPGLKILENLVLEHGLGPSGTFKRVKFPINNQTVLWLQDIAGDVTSPLPDEPSNRYNFQKFVISTLAEVYETGTLNGIVDYNLASKYYYQLFVNFKCINARRKLVFFYINQHLPTEYHETVKNWVSRIPALLKNRIETNETNEIDWEDFWYYVWLLGVVHQKGDLLPHNIQEASKWLYLMLYLKLHNDTEKAKRIEQNLANLPPLDSSKKMQIVSELCEITTHIRTTSPCTFKVMSRILGDIFYDNKIVDQNIDESIYSYTESANKNNSLAAFALGKIYKNDKQDTDTCIKWYMLSARLGHKDALNALTEMVDQEENASLVSFLERYTHQSLVDESELVNIKPLKNLEVYPKTAEKMFEVGKSCLNSGSKEDILSAAYWFRRAMRKGSIDAAIEIYSMYKSGVLGINLIQSAENLYLDILDLCYFKLKKSGVVQSAEMSKTVALLKKVSSVLKMSNMRTANTLNQKIEILISRKGNINIREITDVISGVEAVILELYSQSTVSHAVDVCLLAEEVSDSVNLDV